MRALAKTALAFGLLLVLAGAAFGAGAEFTLRADGWYAPPQAVTEVVDYSVNYSSWLAGDTIAASTWTYGSGINHAAESINAAKTATTTWLYGGTAGQKYTITNTVTTEGGRTWYAVFKIEVK